MNRLAWAFVAIGTLTLADGVAAQGRYPGTSAPTGRYGVPPVRGRYVGPC
jgi:hypothetical protein